MSITALYSLPRFVALFMYMEVSVVISTDCMMNYLRFLRLVIFKFQQMLTGVPHATVIASILPWAAFILKFVQMTYCRLVSLRKGDAKKNDDNRLSTTRHSGYSKRGSAAFSSGTYNSSSEDGSHEEVLKESCYANEV